jgi:hypothetical protein
MPTRPPRFPSSLCSFALPALLLGLLLPACSSGSDSGEPLSYHQDIKPLVDRYCVGCHVQGGIGPFSLSTYDEVVRAADSVRSAVDAGRMPPWPPSSRTPGSSSCSPVSPSPHSSASGTPRCRSSSARTTR